MKVLQGFFASAIAYMAISASAATAPLPPAEDFFDRPEFERAKISPSGRYLAMRTPLQKNGRYMLVVYDSQAMKLNVAARFATLDVRDFMWVNDERLAFDSDDEKMGLLERVRAPGLWSVNADGSNLVQLARQSWKVSPPISRPTLDVARMYQPVGEQDSNWIYVLSTGLNNRYPEPLLMRLNTVTREIKRVVLPSEAHIATMDESGEPRFATTRESSGPPLATVHVREGSSDQWHPLISFDPYKEVFTPLTMSRDGTIYVNSRNGDDKLAVHTYDSKTKVISGLPAIKMEKHDFDGKLIIRDGKLRGIHYLGDEEGTQWIDEEYRFVQEEVDKLMPGTINRLDFPRRSEALNVLVTSYSDTSPVSTWLFNRTTHKLQLVGVTHPKIKPSQMGEQGMVRYAARDGMEIPALLTLPQGNARKNMPMVVLVHGGPWHRGAKWGWNPQSQFLASRGYAVLEPEFRGSTGYGDKHFKAGFKQWGLKMQDDVADGVKWAVAQGYADPKRVCIAGASYGGYSAMMGLVNNQELFQCGISSFGVSDLNLLFNGHWFYKDDLDQYKGWNEYAFPEMIGDVVKDAAQFKATSPLEQANRILKPVLLAHGSSDQRVPVIHGLKLRDAIKQVNQDVEWVEYEREGHGFYLPANEIDFWQRVERLLARTIGPGSKQ